MKILITSDWNTDAINGVVTSINNLMYGLRARGHEVKLLELSSNHQTRITDDGWEVASLPADFVYPEARVRVGLMNKIYDKVIEWGPDIVHSQCEFSTFLMAHHIAHECDIPIVHTYHGIVYAEKFGNEGAYITKATSQLMRDLGCIQSPQNAYLLNLGLESLHVRVPRHCENALAVAKFLQGHDKVNFVTYPLLEGDRYYDRAMKYLKNGACGVVSFEIKGGREAALKFMKSLKLWAIETHVADARSCCLNPATATHRQMNDEQLKECGITAGLIRLSCGIEDKEDLIRDIEQALNEV